MSESEPLTRFQVGDHVVKNSGDYTYAGTVVAAFRKLSGVIRYVVEDDRGLLFIFNETQLEAARRTGRAEAAEGGGPMRWEEAQAVVGEPCPACGQPGEIDWKETTTLLDRESQFTQGATACRTDGCPLKGQWVRSGDRAKPLTPADFARAVDMVYALDVTRRHMFGWVMSPDVHARWRRYGRRDQENKEAVGSAPFVFDPGRPQPASHLIGLPIRVVDGVDLQALEWRTA